MRVCVIGGGHNGLVAANVLAEAGVEVEVFEARNVPGGLADSREFKGVKVSRASYVLGLMPSSLVKKFGIPTIKQDPFQTLFVDGKVYPFWREPEKRRKELLTRGLELFPEFDRKLLEFKKMIDEEFTFLDSPPSMEDVKEEAKRRGVEEIMELSSGKFLERYLPKELHRAFIYPGMYDSPAYLVAYFYSPQWSVVPGGMGTIGKILAQRAQSLGAKLRLGNLVSRIEAEGGRIKWIESGRKKFQFDAVISATSPLVTWKLIGEAPKVQSMRPHWVKYNMVFREIPKLPEALKPFYASILDIEAGELLFHSASDDSLGE
ncbi:hypothetical protein HS1genome_0857 [Sulfodiicoccus acidiphilus]|uniref:Pyridine nucleotide-disulfide oxidoreductase domain-containing protein 2 n=1 Tax=Sulfodiicoccus acidiphilus TaxID=1670455 RepID=A0A348B2R6_9CREN|nr:NAD(P)/FAD-dependent oxidoreductase [Sulfodiicoccus acidiphilus]BBD72468.1 hypothetical protein HS1genome_0857 [Sulfodiicoccus acidiphilus]